MEEVSGGVITAYGGLGTDTYTRNNEAAKEKMEVMNVGVVGNTGSSIFWTNQVITADQTNAIKAAQVANVNAIQSTSAGASALSTYASLSPYTSQAGVTYTPFSLSPGG